MRPTKLSTLIWKRAGSTDTPPLRESETLCCVPEDCGLIPVWCVVSDVSQCSVCESGPLHKVTDRDRPHGCWRVAAVMERKLGAAQKVILSDFLSEERWKHDSDKREGPDMTQWSGDIDFGSDSDQEWHPLSCQQGVTAHGRTGQRNAVKVTADCVVEERLVCPRQGGN